MKRKLDGYYRHVPEDILADVDKLTKLLMECDGTGINEIMVFYFRDYWTEFQEFWAQCGERIDWLTFALAPHNSDRFIIYVFREHPEVRVRVMEDYYEN